MKRTIVLAILVAAACAPIARTAPPSATPDPEGRDAMLPPIPQVEGTLRIDVVYPGEGQRLGTRDRNFIFGNVGTGGASLTINGAEVDVAPNGAFLAYLPVPEDGVYRLAAGSGAQRAELVRTVELPAPAAASRMGAGGIVEGSVVPREVLLETEGRPIDVRFRAAPGASARLVLPDGTIVPLSERAVEERTTGFMLDRTDSVRGISEYSGVFPAVQIGGLAEDAIIEIVRGTDTLRVPLDARIDVLRPHAPRVAVVTSDRPDGMAVGTAVAGGGTPYNWFFPNGARLTITGTRGSEHRVALTDDLEVWVDTAALSLLPEGTPVPRGSVGTVAAVSYPEYVEVRLAMSEALPFRVDPSERGLRVTVYGAETRTNWLQYGSTADTLIRKMEWEQVADDRYVLDIDLSTSFWGYLMSYDGSTGVVRVRRPPSLDPNDPLRGLYIAVDAGHPPGGATGPTRLSEADANLAIAKLLVAMLRERGARVLEIRPDTAAVGLGDRPQMATDSSVHLLVSVHNNAFPDGVNPFERNGTSVFYNQVQSIDLARAFQVELLREFGLRDLGIARADLALTRPTWMPSALTETMFLMIPEQEAALRNPEVHERAAEAHVRAIIRFLREIDG